MTTAPSEPPAKSRHPSSVSNDGPESGGDSGLSASQVEKRRDFTKKQNLRRQVYRDMTVFQMFPLQAMAMDKHEEQLECYVGGGEDGGDDDSDGSVCAPRRGDQARCFSEECDLRKQFRREFLDERSIPVPAAGVMSGYPPANGAQVVNPVQREDSAPVTADEGNSSSDDKQNEESKAVDVGAETDTILPSSGDQKSIANAKQRQFLPVLWSMEPRIFAMETAIKGKRRYISAHLGRFMDHYWRECDVHNRHYYELIKEGAPCRLYFDLEFNKRANPNLTPTVTEDLLNELFDELRHQFQITYGISIDRSGVVDLDSSTPKKFSRHWILHLPNGELFSDAREAGIFVKALVLRLDEEKESGTLISKGRELLADNLLVNAEDSGEGDAKLTRFIDLGVYTRNRIFRLMGSTKFGKPPSAALRVAEANEFPFPAGFDNTKLYLPAMSNTTSDSSEAAPSLQDADFDTFCHSLSWEDHAAAMATTLVVPANLSKMDYPILTDPSNLLSEEERQQIMGLRIGHGSGASGISLHPRATQSYGKSPFSALEDFVVNTLGRREGHVGNIATWSIGTQQPLPQTMAFNMKDNRFCENVGRAHKSNNIVWNVHLIDRVCWQSCHDPECRGFRGKVIDLPEEVDAEIDEYFLDCELSSLNENNILENKENGDGEFDDPELDAALQRVDIPSAAQETEAEAALDDELAKLNLEDILSDVKGLSNRGVCASNQATLAKKRGEEKSTMRSPDPEPSENSNDSDLDSELLELASKLRL